jgi:hypothetical protein
LKDTVLRIERTKIITEEMTAARHQALKNATTHGKKFHATGGCHITSDDVFIGAELGLREKEKTRLLTKKKKCLRMMEIYEKGKRVLEAKGNDSSRWLVADLDAVLTWYGVAKLGTLGKVEKLEKWASIQENNGQPKEFERWTDGDEAALIEASREDIELGDTALGRLQKKKKADFVKTARKFTDEEWAEMTAARSTENQSTMTIETGTTDSEGAL